MGGQACVFYGAAQFSKDVDLALLPSEENFSRLLSALGELNAKRIAVPPFEPFSKYGAAMRQGRPEFVRFVNGVIQQLKASGKWKEIFSRHPDVFGAPRP